MSRTRHTYARKPSHVIMIAQLNPNMDQTPKLRYEYQQGDCISREWNRPPLGLASFPVAPIDPHRHRRPLGVQHQRSNLLFQPLSGKDPCLSGPGKLGSLADFSSCLLNERDGIGVKEKKKKKRKGLGGRKKKNRSRKGRVADGGMCKIASRSALEHASGGVSCSCTKMRLVDLSSHACKSLKDGSSAPTEIR